MPPDLSSSEESISQFVRDYRQLAGLFSAQPAATQLQFDRQACALSDGLSSPGGRIRFQLPEQVILEGGETVCLPPAARKRSAGNPFGVRRRANKLDALVRHLDRLEQSLNPAIAACGNLLSYALARHMLYDLIPEPKTVRHRPEEGDGIPSIPVDEDSAFAPALVAVGAGAGELEFALSNPRGLQVRYATATRRFYLPQRVAFDQDGGLLADSIDEGEACVASLQGSYRLLQEAAMICPSIVADETYQRKRAGILAQLVDQGRALARYYANEIVSKIRRRAEDGSLNRGLRLSLPYFDDGEMALRLHEMEIIPGGRIVFLPAFVVRAMQQERARVTRDLRISQSSRRHLLKLLAGIEQAFDDCSSND